MFLSTYIPVDMHRVNCAVYSAEKVFPEKRLLEAYKLVTGEHSDCVYGEDGCITFIDDPSIKWSLPEVFLAEEAYRQAKESNFSYYRACNEEGIPQLFISNQFKGHRLITNAFSMRTIILCNTKLVSKAASLIDKTISNLASVDLFNSMSAIEAGSAKFLPGLIAYRGTSEEFLAVSPTMTPLAVQGTIYGSDEMEEIKVLVEGGEMTDDFSYVKGEKGIYRNDIDKSSIIPEDVAEYLVKVYNSMKEKKSNYVELVNDDYVTDFYFSTNHRYLVNARTFECVVLKNQHLKSLLTSLSKATTVSKDQLQMVWMLAKTE